MNSFPLLIAWRYIRATRRKHFISFMTGVSIAGIALGVAILITVLSVMNGFNQVIRERILSMAHHITIQSPHTSFPTSTWAELRTEILQHPNILGAAPIATKQALILQKNYTRPIYLHGILPTLEKTVSSLPKHLKSSDFFLKKGEYQIILGKQLALELGVQIGDQLPIMIPPNDPFTAKLKPQIKLFTVTDIFKIGRGFGFEQYITYTHVEDIKTLYQLEDHAINLRLKIKDLYNAPRIANELNKRFHFHLIKDWTEEYGDLLYAIKLEKNMMFLTLLLLIAMAAFNLVSSLTIVVTDKRADIAILRTLGASPWSIFWIFILQGGLIGLSGTILGVIGGILVSSQITSLVSFIEQCFHIELFSNNAYLLVDQLPAHIESVDVFKVSISALLISLMATLYPARRAFKIAPAEALRYE